MTIKGLVPLSGPLKYVCRPCLTSLMNFFISTAALM